MKEVSINKVKTPKAEQLKMLEMIVRDIFGLNTKLNFDRWKIEQDHLKIEDIDFDEDLLTVLQRLRDHFYVSLDTRTEEVEVLGRKTITSRLDLELYPK